MAFCCESRLAFDRGRNPKEARMRALCKTLLIGISMLALAPGANVGAQTAAYTISITATGYQPTQVTVPANQAFQLTISNVSAQAVELEGKPLVGLVGLNPGANTTVSIDPTVAGTYSIIDDLHPALGPLTLIVQ
jgi:plastocyanin